MKGCRVESKVPPAVSRLNTNLALFVALVPVTCNLSQRGREFGGALGKEVARRKQWVTSLCIVWRELAGEAPAVCRVQLIARTTPSQQMASLAAHLLQWAS